MLSGKNDPKDKTGTGNEKIVIVDRKKVDRVQKRQRERKNKEMEKTRMGLKRVL